MCLPLGRNSSFLWTESLEEDRALLPSRGARRTWQRVPPTTCHIPSATGCFSFTVFYSLQNSCLICLWEKCLGRMAWESQLSFYAFIISGVPTICLALGHSCSEQGPQGVCCVLCRSDHLRNSALLKISLGVEGHSVNGILTNSSISRRTEDGQYLGHSQIMKFKILRHQGKGNSGCGRCPTQV